MHTEPGPAQLFSPAFPAGGFAFSQGLEWLTKSGQVARGSDLGGFLETLLTRGSGWTDAVLFASAAKGDDPEALDALARALAPSATRRRETLVQGAALARVMRDGFGRDLPDMAYPVAGGRAAHLLGHDPEEALRMWLFSTCQTLAAAAQRLMPLGQTEAQVVLARIAPVVADLAARAVAAEPDDLGGFAPVLDIAAQSHDTLDVKLFQS
ncbi:urease accessory protein UreF [Litorisediminicola beolgyonensis]|uniref:Urease accessory protein UreF n=1 Tax=Litorisediminicola beolgyonensis TaxID=1173614 RepID=A0ABW3ZNP6_9RHOB